MIKETTIEYEIIIPHQNRWIITKLPNAKKYILVEEDKISGAWTIIARFEDMKSVASFVTLIKACVDYNPSPQ